MASSSSKTQQKKNIWLMALNDPLAGTTSPSQNICLSDINGDGEYLLIIGDDKKSLRVWKGQSITSQLTLREVPNAVFSFYADATPPIKPWISIICGNIIYFYKSVGSVLRPRAKIDLPLFEPHPEEKKIWEELKKDAMPLDDALDKFDELRIKGNILTPQAARLLAQEDTAVQEAIINEVKQKGPVWRFVYIIYINIYICYFFIFFLLLF